MVLRFTLACLLVVEVLAIIHKKDELLVGAFKITTAREKADAEWAILNQTLFERTPTDDDVAVAGQQHYLDFLRGGESLSASQVELKVSNAVPGTDYPTLAHTTDVSNFSCWDVQLTGYYADVDNRHLIRSCSYFYNVICERSAKLAD
ncbi:hypothetical protein BV898_11536 [Hypsibius exemplaris]|uniref:C-type lectin domain-containing protein n=1 Tax=Hypsibius exemplaris TaxID=2072580 RepID=A0A1W0WGH7_HYPEX|nr:hypothetical protein BV898_11536 [Hypsibius exemplaris]